MNSRGPGRRRIVERLARGDRAGVVSGLLSEYAMHADRGAVSRASAAWDRAGRVRRVWSWWCRRGCAVILPRGSERDRHRGGPRFRGPLVRRLAGPAVSRESGCRRSPDQACRLLPREFGLPLVGQRRARVGHSRTGVRSQGGRSWASHGGCRVPAIGNRSLPDRATQARSTERGGASSPATSVSCSNGIAAGAEFPHARHT